MSISFYSNIQYILSSEMIAETDEHELTKRRQKGLDNWSQEEPRPVVNSDAIVWISFLSIVRVLSRGFHCVSFIARIPSIVQVLLRGLNRASFIAWILSCECHWEIPSARAYNKVRSVQRASPGKPVKYLTKSDGQRPKAGDRLQRSIKQANGQRNVIRSKRNKNRKHALRKKGYRSVYVQRSICCTRPVDNTHQ